MFIIEKRGLNTRHLKTLILNQRLFVNTFVEFTINCFVRKTTK